MGIPLKGQAQGPAILICLQLSPHPHCLQKSSPQIVSQLWPLSRTRSPVTSSHGILPHQWDETSGGRRLLLTLPTCTCLALPCPSSHIPIKSHTLDFRAPFFPPAFLDTGFFWDGDLAFLAGGGVMMASNFPLDPRFFASNSGWMFGNTPPLAMVTPFSSLKENQSSRWLSQTSLPHLSMFFTSTRMLTGPSPLHREQVLRVQAKHLVSSLLSPTPNKTFRKNS